MWFSRFTRNCRHPNNPTGTTADFSLKTNYSERNETEILQRNLADFKQFQARNILPKKVWLKNFFRVLKELKLVSEIELKSVVMKIWNSKNSLVFIRRIRQYFSLRLKRNYYQKLSQPLVDYLLKSNRSLMCHLALTPSSKLITYTSSISYQLNLPYFHCSFYDSKARQVTHKTACR